jgi:hypothetical protein
MEAKTAQFRRPCCARLCWPTSSDPEFSIAFYNVHVTLGDCGHAAGMRPACVSCYTAVNELTEQTASSRHDTREPHKTRPGLASASFVATPPILGLLQLYSQLVVD